MSEHRDLQQEEIPTRQEQVRMLSERVDDLQRRLRDYGCYAEELDKIIAAIPTPQDSTRALVDMLVNQAKKKYRIQTLQP